MNNQGGLLGYAQGAPQQPAPPAQPTTPVQSQPLPPPGPQVPPNMEQGVMGAFQAGQQGMPFEQFLKLPPTQQLIQSGGQMAVEKLLEAHTRGVQGSEQFRNPNYQRQFER